MPPKKRTVKRKVAARKRVVAKRRVVTTRRYVSRKRATALPIFDAPPVIALPSVVEQPGVYNVAYSAAPMVTQVPVTVTPARKVTQVAVVPKQQGVYDIAYTAPIPGVMQVPVTVAPTRKITQVSVTPTPVLDPVSWTQFQSIDKRQVRVVTDQMSYSNLWTLLLEKAFIRYVSADYKEINEAIYEAITGVEMTRQQVKPPPLKPGRRLIYTQNMTQEWVSVYVKSPEANAENYLNVAQWKFIANALYGQSTYFMKSAKPMIDMPWLGSALLLQEFILANPTPFLLETKVYRGIRGLYETSVTNKEFIGRPYESYKSRQQMFDETKQMLIDTGQDDLAEMWDNIQARILAEPNEQKVRQAYNSYWTKETTEVVSVDLRAAYAVGNVIQQTIFWSTSLDPGVADAFTRGSECCFLELTIPAGHPIHARGAGYEAEVLLPPLRADGSVFQWKVVGHQKAIVVGKNVADCYHKKSQSEFTQCVENMRTGAPRRTVNVIQMHLV